MKPHLNFIYIVILAGLAIFAIRIQLMGQMKVVEQALANQSAAVESLRSDIGTITAFLNERTNVRVEISR
ncbi:MAG: hypothetical protein HYT31_02505 [Parcubacteria group bacterium]|nr:hypothetical protein [Parcubacteria group bacterium]